MEDVDSRRLNLLSFSELEIWLVIVGIRFEKSSLAFDKVNVLERII